MKMQKLSEISILLNGYAFKSKNYTPDGVRVIRIANVQDGFLSDEQPCFYPANGEIEKYMLKDGDLLISLTGNVGRVAIMDINLLPAALNQRVCCIRFSNVVLPKYVFYYLRRKQFVKECVLASKGVAQLNLSTKWLENYEIPVLSLEEQERIVARIEELFSELDSGVQTLQKVKEQLRVYRQAVLKDAFEGMLIGSTYAIKKKLKNYIEKPKYGTSKKCVYEHDEESVPVFRIPNVDYDKGYINWDDIKYTTFTLKELETIQLEKDDILIIRSNGSVSLVGRAAIVKESDVNGTFAGYLMRLRIINKKELNPKYLLWYLQSYEARMYIESKAKSTSGVNNINSIEISDLSVPIYSIKEQEKIIDAIEKRLSVCDNIEQTVDTVLKQAEALRQSILKKAFEGGLA